MTNLKTNLMKKLFFVLSFCATMNSAFSEDGLYDDAVHYSIISDLKDEAIAPGTFVVEGVVKMQSGNMPFQDVIVGMLERTGKTVSDSAGHFSLVCKTGSDSSLYFYKDGWSEIVINNYVFKDQHRITLVAYMSKYSVQTAKRLFICTLTEI